MSMCSCFLFYRLLSTCKPPQYQIFSVMFLAQLWALAQAELIRSVDVHPFVRSFVRSSTWWHVLTSFDLEASIHAYKLFRSISPWSHKIRSLWPLTYRSKFTFAMLIQWPLKMALSQKVWQQSVLDLDRY